MDEPVTKETLQRWLPSEVTREHAAEQTAIALSLPSPNLRAAKQVCHELLSLPLTISPLELCEPLESLDAVSVIVERTTGERVAVSLPQPLWHAALASLLGPSARTSVPLEAERGALLYLAARLTQAALGDAFYVAGVTTTTESLCAALGIANAAGARWCARATVSIGDTPGSVVLFCATPLPEPTSSRSEHLASISVPCAITCGEVSLRISELRTIAEGDVILLDRFGMDLKKVGLNGCVRLAPLEGAALYWECVMHDGEVTLKGMETDDPPPPTHANLQDLPIRLHVELARLSMTVGELGALRVGHVLRLAKSTGDVVTLSAGGQPIATGEVVDVEGELGFRVTNLETSLVDNRDAP